MKCTLSFSKRKGVKTPANLDNDSILKKLSFLRFINNLLHNTHS